jgi:arabinofuranan 3-O-arabinosyltransferase
MIPQPLLGTPGLDEVEIPGVRVVESLRLPTWLATATRGLDLTRNAMTVELQRDTADFPFRPSASDDDADPETGMERLVTLPTRRRFEISGWAAPLPRAPDTVFDRLAGMPTDWSLQSSSRFEGLPSRRASSAFDGDPATAWVGDYDQEHRARLIIRSPRAFTLRRLGLVRGPSEYAFPDRVDVDAGGEVFRDLEVRSDGAVLLPRPVKTQYLSVEVTDVAAPSSAGARRQLPAVAVGEMDVPGLRPPTPRRVGRFRTPCGALAVRSRLSTATASVSGTIEALDRGAALRVNGCGPGRSLELPAGTGRVTATGTTMRPYLLSLGSPGASADSAAPPAPGLVQSQGHGGDGDRSGVRLQLRRPAWLVLGEGYARGWRASCRSADGKERELGAPQPIDGFANGWRVGASCSVARFWFAPQTAATISYVISAVAGLALLVVLLAAPLLRRRGAQARRNGTDLPTWEADDFVVRLPPERAVALGVALGLAGAWFFAVRTGVALAVAVAVVTSVGVSSRRLLWLAMPLIAVIPLQYISAPRSGAQGFFAYANQRLASHWLAVAAVCAIAGACLLDARRLRRSLAGVRR